MAMRFVDAHHHLQDARLDAERDAIVASLREEGVDRWVANGTCETDWERVTALFETCPEETIPSYGLHPWKVRGRSTGWADALEARLAQDPGACVGEVGLDKWIREADLDDQEEVLRVQLNLAVSYGRPVSLHCLRCFGRLLEVLRDAPLPEQGFLLHAYSGPAELVPDFLELGARFSFSGYFLEPRKAIVRDVFRDLPEDRILVETDAPDMPLPEAEERFPLGTDSQSGKRLNHPANLRRVYQGLANLRQMSELDLTARVRRTFASLFEAHALGSRPGRG